MINKSIDEIEAELNQIGRPLANDAGVSSWTFCQIDFYETTEVCCNL